MQTLLIFSHTFWKDSKVNRALLESAKTLSNVKIHNLNESYKDGVINAESEVALLKDSQKIIFQFPLFWFSTPALKDSKISQPQYLNALVSGLKIVLRLYP